MPTAQASRDGHRLFVCHTCDEEKPKSEIESDGFEYVCGDCQ